MRDITQKVLEEIKSLEVEYSGNAPMSILLANMKEQGVPESKVGVALDTLVSKKIVREVAEGYFRVSINGQPRGVNMNKVNKNQLTKEQNDFRTLVCNNKSKIYKAQEEAPFLTHRGVQIAFGGCGEQAFRYKVALDLGLSDKEPVENVVLYLDWNDSALYDEGGIASQLKELLEEQAVQNVALRPVKISIGGK